MSISPNAGGPKVKHNYYADEDHFSADPIKGVILDPDGRTARVSEDFVIAMHQSFEQNLGGQAGSVVFYNVGKRWGEKHFKSFADRMRAEYGDHKHDVQSMNMQFVMESWWWPLTSTGFGGWSIDLTHRDKNVTVVEIRNSLVAQSLERGNKPVCHIYAGLFAGAFSVYDNDSRSSIELECYSMGSDCCKFIVGGEEKVNAADFWRTEGATASDIVKQL